MMATARCTPEQYPKAVILVAQDGSQIEFPLHYPPQATGFTFRVAINELHSIKYSCWAEAKPIDQKGTHDEGMSKSP